MLLIDLLDKNYPGHRYAVDADNNITFWEGANPQPTKAEIQQMLAEQDAVALQEAITKGKAEINRLTKAFVDAVIDPNIKDIYLQKQLLVEAYNKSGVVPKAAQDEWDNDWSQRPVADRVCDVGQTKVPIASVEDLLGVWQQNAVYYGLLSAKIEPLRTKHRYLVSLAQTVEEAQGVVSAYEQALKSM